MVDRMQRHVASFNLSPYSRITIYLASGRQVLPVGLWKWAAVRQDIS